MSAATKEKIIEIIKRFENSLKNRKSLSDKK
jgi:hypothetical protein